MVEEHHAYAGIGTTTYCFCVYEEDRMVAAFSWLPPPAGAAKAICPEAPFAVLALSRMVAVPKNERKLKHISLPLKLQMNSILDRTRWPVLVTYSDEGLGHNGFVYQCSGWEKTARRKAHIYEDHQGKRQSKYSNGTSTGRPDLIFKGTRFIQRWESWNCPRGKAAEWVFGNGWERVAVAGKFWKSGNQAFSIKKRAA